MAGTTAKLGGIVASVLDARKVGGDCLCALAGDGALSLEAWKTNNQNAGFSATAGSDGAVSGRSSRSGYDHGSLGWPEEEPGVAQLVEIRGETFIVWSDQRDIN
jgi:hypothetical protein